MNPGISNLSIEQRIRLVEDVWDSIVAEQGNLVLTDAQREELDCRLDALEQDGQAGAEAAEVMEGIRKRL